MHSSKDLQEKIIQNKKDKGFFTNDITKEFCLLYGEVAEAYEAWRIGEGTGLELADIGIYLMGISEILGFDLLEEIERKIEINAKREYVKNEHGVLVKKQ